MKFVYQALAARMLKCGLIEIGRKVSPTFNCSWNQTLLILSRRYSATFSTSSTIMLTDGSIKSKIKNQPAPKYPLKQVEIITCQDLYTEWSKTSRKHRNTGLPSDGLAINVEYCDTHSKAPSEAPVVLALHGAPGNHTDFINVIEHLSARGVRIVAPNFPDFKVTRDSGVYTHTPEEKHDFLDKFLQAIKLEKIDMLILHSSAIFPFLLLTESSMAPKIKSVAMFNPCGHRRIQGMRLWPIFSALIWLYRTKLGFKFIQNFSSVLFPLFGVPLDPNNADYVALAGFTMLKSEHQFPNVKQQFVNLRNRSTQMLYLFSDNDKLIEKEIFHEIGQFLSVTDSNTTVYNKDGSVKKVGKHEDNLSVIRFVSGGHYAFKKHSMITNEALWQLLQTALDESSDKINGTLEHTSKCYDKITLF